MLTTKALCMRIISLSGMLLFSSPSVYACNCANASLHGDQINVYMHPDAKRQVTINNTVELPQVNEKVVPGSLSHRFNIDIKKSSILIDFDHGLGESQSRFGINASLHFDDINPQLTDSNCTTKIAGMYIQTNNPEATWLNAKSTFSDNTVRVVFGGDTLQGNNNSSANWSKSHWIKVNLSFDCSAAVLASVVRKGMTWGYRGQSIPGGPAELVAVGCNSATEWSSGQGMCDPYRGETSCSAKRHILCVEEKGNIPRPAYSVNPGKENASGWSPGAIRLGPEVRGDQLTSLGVANDFCGNDWRMAGFHDGHWIQGMDAENHHATSNPQWNLAEANSSGGWNFHAQFMGNEDKLHSLKTERFWVHIKDQGANCWDSIEPTD